MQIEKDVYGEWCVDCKKVVVQQGLFAVDSSKSGETGAICDDCLFPDDYKDIVWDSKLAEID